ncbi:MAG: PHP-associated domain-containing protein [Candidatus Bathyarchaeia archaeon]
MVRVDLHLHTVFSGDSSIDPKVVVEQLQRQSIVKGVAITDHNSLEGYFRVRKLAEVYEDLVILPGIEISTSDGDVIVLGVEEKPEHPVTLDGAVDFAKTTDGLVIVPHPYRVMGVGDLAMNIEAHAIEVLNPTATSKENALAKKLAKTKNLPGVAGTDAHNEREMWTVFTEVEAQPDVGSVLEALRKGLVKAVDARSASLLRVRG